VPEPEPVRSSEVDCTGSPRRARQGVDTRPSCRRSREQATTAGVRPTGFGRRDDAIELDRPASMACGGAPASIARTSGSCLCLVSDVALRSLKRVAAPSPLGRDVLRRDHSARMACRTSPFSCAGLFWRRPEPARRQRLAGRCPRRLSWVRPSVIANCRCQGGSEGSWPVQGRRGAPARRTDRSVGLRPGQLECSGTTSMASVGAGSPR
jgi:hypothetical protein